MELDYRNIDEMRRKFEQAYSDVPEQANGADIRAESDGISSHDRAGHPAFYSLAQEEVDLHDRKNREYATSQDPLGNFRRSGRLIAKLLKPGVNPALAACLIFMAKQVDGVYEIVGEGKTDTVEQLDDKLRDIGVYTKIATILARE